MAIRITKWALLGYDTRTGEGKDYQLDMGRIKNADETLFNIYSRDITNREVGLMKEINEKNWRARAFITIGIVYRILHEEIFEALRKLLHVKIPDPYTR
jgi:hypothetical protein